MEWLVKDIHAELKAWGRPGGSDNKIVMKSDGESPIVAVREALARKHGGVVSPEQPPKGEHASNGVVEEAGKTITDLSKVFKIQLEARLKQELDIEAPILQWMARWAAMAISRFRVGKDGKTAYERLKGKKSKALGLEFGEELLWKRRAERGALGKMAIMWERGVFP